jgi:subtilase family serine protease
LYLRVTLVVALSTFAAFSCAAVASAAAVPPALRIPAPWRDLGRAAPSTRIDVAIVLNYHNDAELDRLVEEQTDEASPLYHRFLTPQQFARYFAPTTAEYTATIALLERAGFAITNTSPNRTVIDAATTSAVAERFFSTEIHLVRREDGSVKHINIRPETIPAALAGEVLGVVGLDDAHQMHPQYVRLPPGTQLPNAVPAGSNPLFGPDGGYGPQIYRTSYDFPAGMDGTGRASGVVGDADFLDSDLAGYLKYFDVKRTGPKTARVLVDGGPPRGLSGDSIETTLDVETIVSIAPGTALYVYEAPPEPDLRYFTDLYNRAVSDNKVDTVNTSYSECETAFVPSFPKASDAIEKQGAALGITFHSATGDHGVETYGCNGITVGTPADTPHNVAIGGTIEEVDHTTGKETREVGWNDSSGATGGGVSKVFPLPAFQKKVTTVIARGRNIPDVAFDASPFTGESFYFRGGFQGPIGGTSLASPIFGAGLTIIDEIKKARAGFFNFKLYNTWEADGYSKGSTTYFRDVVSGSISPYKAGPGYDQMSGIGVMLFGNDAVILP